MSGSIPELHVEGPHDVSLISSLLKRHGVDTDKGKQYLNIKASGSDLGVLDLIQDTVRASSDRPVGFVIDIDTEVLDRWQAVRQRLQGIEGLAAPAACPEDGYLGRVPDYPHPFGIWLMPDCRMSGGKLEHLVQTLVPEFNPLWPHAQQATGQAESIVQQFNAGCPADQRCESFRSADRIKAEIYTWLAWTMPSAPVGAAVLHRFLRHDSPEAIAFLRWLKGLYPTLPISV
jgi:hypothetical protein